MRKGRPIRLTVADPGAGVPLDGVWAEALGRRLDQSGLDARSRMELLDRLLANPPSQDET